MSLIYQKAGGDSWEDKDKENWNSEEDLGKWKNVKVNEEGRVTELSIRGSGEIPAEISGLTELKNLYLFLPDEVQFPEVPESLESLDISGGCGTIPESYYDLSNLKRISITTSGLKGGIDPKVANLKNLEHLQVDQTAGLIGSVDAAEAVLPAEIFSMDNLKRIFLRKVSTSGVIPATIGEMKNLQSITIAACGLTGEIPKEVG
ncbi:MAG: hypothetical protein IJJ96_03675, partial [Bacteroidales bacterium]|nr:hypothetical protein [Bacteroidales bacterium]